MAQGAALSASYERSEFSRRVGLFIGWARLAQLLFTPLFGWAVFVMLRSGYHSGSLVAYLSGIGILLMTIVGFKLVNTTIREMRFHDKYHLDALEDEQTLALMKQLAADPKTSKWERKYSKTLIFDIEYQRDNPSAEA